MYEMIYKSLLLCTGLDIRKLSLNIFSRIKEKNENYVKLYCIYVCKAFNHRFRQLCEITTVTCENFSVVAIK